MKRIRVRLTAEAYAHAMELAGEMAKKSRDWQAKRIHIEDGRTLEDSDDIGARGQLAVSVYYELPFPKILDGIKDDSLDTAMHDGRTVQVKTVHQHPQGVLLVKQHELGIANLYILCMETDTRMEIDILGWLTSEKFLEKAERQRFHDKPLGVWEKDLRDPAELHW